MEFLQGKEPYHGDVIDRNNRSPLRQRMFDDMTMRAMKSRTQHDYVRHVRAYAAFLGRSPDTATAEDNQAARGEIDDRAGIADTVRFSIRQLL